MILISELLWKSEELMFVNHDRIINDIYVYRYICVCVNYITTFREVTPKYIFVIL
jgi:hypothetical protein